MKDPNHDLTAFAKAVETGSFSAAARASGTTPSAVSKAVARLESRLGTRLFKRSTRVLSLTDEGEVYYGRVAPLLRQLADAEDLFRGDVAVQGSLRVSMPSVLGHVLVDAIAARFLVEYPDIRLEIGLADRRVDVIAEGYDLALRVGELPDTSLRRRRLRSIRLCLVASPAYLDAAGRPVRRTDLSAHRHVRYIVGRQAYPLRFADGEAIAPNAALDLDNGSLMVRAAANGAGIAQILEVAVEAELRTGRLERVLPGEAMLELPVQILHAFERHVPLRARLFMDFIAGELDRDTIIGG